MMPGRRRFLVLGGALAALSAPTILRATPVAVIEMTGTPRGERVWFAPLGLAVAPGTTIRFINRDPGNSHTATAYHPDNFGRQLRIPEAAAPWDSGYLLPDESFEVVLGVPGVYDYYCKPHEHADMVGRIVVGKPGRDAGWQGPAPVSDDLSEVALAAFPSVDQIFVQGEVLPKDVPWCRSPSRQTLPIHDPSTRRPWSKRPASATRRRCAN